jgi:hypothetical protein
MARNFQPRYQTGNRWLGGASNASVNPDLAAVSGPEGVEATFGVGALIGMRAEEISQPLGEQR